MSERFKPSRWHPRPPGAEVVDRGGRPHVRLTARGRPAYFALSADGSKYLKPEAKWAADVRMADGTRRRHRLSADKAAAQKVLADLLAKIERQKAGLADPDAVAPARVPLAGYRQHLLDKGTTARQAGQAVRRCERAFAGGRLDRLADLAAGPVDRWLADRRGEPRAAGGLSARTSNHYATALTAFGNWLVRAGHAETNPLRFLGRVNPAVDVRRDRRPLAADEVARLAAAAAAGRPFRKLAGPDRSVLYAVAACTGLRANELATLTAGAFRLDADPPRVVVEAGYSSTAAATRCRSTRPWWPAAGAAARCGRASGPPSSRPRP